MTRTDEELVAGAIRGDAECFKELMIRWELPIFALAYREIGREEAARDVCQEAFLGAYRALPGFRGQATFSSWLYRIALNVCRDWMRRERRAAFVQPPDRVDLIEMAAASEPEVRGALMDAKLEHSRGLGGSGRGPDRRGAGQRRRGPGSG